MLKIKFITTFPESFPGVLGLSLTGKALDKGLWSYEVIDLREFGIGKHRKVDDRPFGGGAGMLLYAEVVANAADHACRDLDNPRKIYVSARGKRFIQAEAAQIARDMRDLVVLCGRFEGVDQRVLDLCEFEEFSIGDFVLSGGEIAAMAMADACIRLLPGVLGNNESAVSESFSIFHNGSCLIEHPQYTRPRTWRGIGVPSQLLSGNHSEADAWKMCESARSTELRRPDLYTEDD